MEDWNFIIELLNSKGWLQFIGDRNVRSRQDAENYLMNGPFKSYEAFGYGLSLVELKRTAQSIGMCGIINRPGLDYPDIGFAFLPKFHGKGYASEMAKAILEYARDRLGLRKISAITVPENINSIKVLEKLGFIFHMPFSLDKSDEQLLLYVKNL